MKVKRTHIPFIGAITSQPYHIVKIPKSSKPIVFEQFEPRVLEWALIGRGNLTEKEGIGWLSQTISNDTKWTEVMNELNKIKNVTDAFVENIDFSKHNAVALLFDSGYNPCTEQYYVMEIESVIEKEVEVVVKYRAILKSDDVVHSKLPFIVFKIPKTDKPILCVRITT